MNLSRSKLTESHVKQEFNGTPKEIETIPECIRHHAEKSPNREAVVFASTDESREAVTFEELYKKSAVLARALIRIGVKRHDFIANNFRTCPEWLYLTFGTMMAGAVPVSISFTYKDGSDVLAIMEKLEHCSMLVVDPGMNGDNWRIIRNLIDDYSSDGLAKSEKIPSLRYLVCHDSLLEDTIKKFHELLSDDSDLCDVKLPNVETGEIATLFQTSGSTGLPKIVAHTHTSLLATIGIKAEDKTGSVFFNDRPFTWLGGFPMSIFVGETRVTISGFCPQPKDKVSFVIDVIKQEKCTTFSTMPPFLHKLMERKDELTEEWPVKVVVVTGQPIKKYLSDCIGTICNYLLCVYAGAECECLALNVVSDPSHYAEYACGSPMEGTEVKIVNEDREIVSINVRGEIYIRRKDIFKEYLNDQKKTTSVKTEDGWYITDDMGWMSENGVLFVDGRKSNMIVSSGMNVTPEMMEDVIKKCPGVDDVIIVPLPDKIKHQILCACVIIKPGCDVTEEEIRDFCEEMHNDKAELFVVLPSYYMFVDFFPETATGKISRPRLIEVAAKKFQTE